MSKPKSKGGWREYKIGNALRGGMYFKARGDLQAVWLKGCRVFNRYCPPNPGSTLGRYIWLEESLSDDTMLIPTTRYLHDQLQLSKSKRDCFNTSLPTRSGWMVIASGMSRQRLVIPKSP